ncbi:hypothetical protein D4740_06395 [Actinomyces sp. 2119]|nr:hypothetical protein D4740_06395 [Actinomyces sp. 2119]
MVIMMAGSRTTFVMSKVFGAAVVSAAVALVGSLGAWGILVSTGLLDGRLWVPGLTVLILGRSAAVVAWGVVGTCTVLTTRSQTAAITLILTVPFVAETAVRTLARQVGGTLEGVTRLLPFASIDALVPVPPGSTLFEEPVNSPETACTVVGCFLALLLTASTRRA